MFNMSKRKIRPLPLLSVLGFSGKVKRGLNILKSNILVYPVGKNVGIWAWKQEEKKSIGQHTLLNGHHTSIVTIATAKDKDVIASAENSLRTDRGTVIIWSGKPWQEVGRYSLHIEEIVSVAVSSDGSFVYSLGGENDGKIIVWDVEAKLPICSAQVTDSGFGIPSIISSSPLTSTLLGVAGRRILKIFCFDKKIKKFAATNVCLGNVERHYTDIKIDEKEEFMYCSTTTGDIAKIRLNLTEGKISSSLPVLVCVCAPKILTTSLKYGTRILREAIPSITSLVILPSEEIIVGDSKGCLRCFRQESEEEQEPQKKSIKQRPFTTSSINSGRAHGTMKTVRPKDPSQPILRQLWSINCKSYITSLAITGKSLATATENSEIREVFLGSLQELTSTPNKESYENKTFNNKNSDKLKGKYRSAAQNKSATLDNISFEDYTAAIPSSIDSSKIGPPYRLVSSCPPGPIYDIAFPKGVSDLVVTAGEFGIRVWNVRNLEELLRIELPGITSKCCVVTSDLSTIISGWIDGRIRGSGSESGFQKWTIEEAHHKSVNSLVIINKDCLISAGADGRIRNWSISTSNCPNLISSSREHRGEIMSLAPMKNEDRVLSCGADGLCIMWKVPSLERLFCLRADTVFLDGCILNREEIVTVGCDGSVLVWHRTDGSLIADLRVTNRPLTSVDVSQDEKLLVTLEEEGCVKVWNWAKGRIILEGNGHSASNTKVKISPDGQFVVSVSKDGTMVMWKSPKL